MHISIPIDGTVELINMTELSPLISKCQIKVCYVGQNRNHTSLSKEVIAEMGKFLPGSPIVGFYNQENGDFEEHNRNLEIEDGKLKLVDATRPYGFVDSTAQVWFQTFLDDDGVEREYLLTEGYIWTESYPEAKRIISEGNNQSMELFSDSVKGSWSGEKNSKDRFFIINEALIERLCVLGQDVEPCFEGAQIKAQFSLEDEFVEFKNKMFAMISELKEALNEGGKTVFTTYAVEIGCHLWDNIWNALVKKFSCFYQDYIIEGIFEEDNSQKFIVLQKRSDMTYCRIDFSYDDSGFALAEDMTDVVKDFLPVERQFVLEDVEAYAAKIEGKTDKENLVQIEKDIEEPAQDYAEKCSKCGKPLEECSCKEYNLEEIPEYIELNQAYTALKQENESLAAELAELKTFKLSIERKEKEVMINSFFMLSDEDKKDVLTNIDNYSLDEIESKLAVICVRNKVSFTLEEDETQPSLSFNLDSISDTTPAWVKAVKEVESKM